jgi:hypothetical protein
MQVEKVPITVAAGPKAWTAFALSDAAIEGSDPTRGMDVCVGYFFISFIYLNWKCVFTGWQWYYNKTQHTNNTHHTK